MKQGLATNFDLSTGSGLQRLTSLLSSVADCVILTQVGSIINRVPDQEQREKSSDDGLSAGILSIKVPSLNSTTSLLRSITLGQALVESNNILHAGGRATGTLSGFRGSNLGWDGKGRVVTYSAKAE